MAILILTSFSAACSGGPMPTAEPKFADEKLPADAPAIGARGNVGCTKEPTTSDQTEITRPGVYEDILFDGKFVAGGLVKIKADDVTLRRCEIRHATQYGLHIGGKNVVVESCKIYHCLAGTTAQQQDANGITGRPENLVIRNCEFYQVTGDCITFDPDRRPWGNVLVENCTFWTGPLDADVAGFKKGDRPGENAFDAKQGRNNPRSTITFRNCLFHGWRNGMITNMAPLNLKENVEVKVENCLFRDNEIAFRLRGETRKAAGALVSIADCAVYDTLVAVRFEDGIRDVKIARLGLGAGVKTKYFRAAGGFGRGYENQGEYVPGPFDQLLKTGVAAKSAK